MINTTNGATKVNNQSASTDKQVVLTKHLIFETNDYDRFSFLDGNRGINDLHVKKLKQSMEAVYLFALIIINEFYQIIDGQHRFLAAKELGLPIRFTIIEGASLADVHRYNAINRVWKDEDYLIGYCDLGYLYYVKMKEFMDKFPEFSILSALRILTQLSSGVKQGTVDGKKVGNAGDFRSGKFIIPDLPKSYEIAERLQMFKPYFEGYTDPTFISAMLKIFSNPDYNHAEMLTKLRIQPTALIPQRNIEQYRLLVEDIYNWRRRTKVNLRF